MCDTPLAVDKTAAGLLPAVHLPLPGCEQRPSRRASEDDYPSTPSTASRPAELRPRRRDRRPKTRAQAPPARRHPAHAGARRRSTNTRSTCSARRLNLIRESLFAGNDAQWLRSRRGDNRPLSAVVEAAAQRWMGSAWAPDGMLIGGGPPKCAFPEIHTGLLLALAACAARRRCRRAGADLRRAARPAGPPAPDRAGRAAPRRRTGSPRW